MSDKLITLLDHYHSFSQFVEEWGMNHFPQEVKASLVQIADWFISHNEDDYMNVCLNLKVYYI